MVLERFNYLFAVGTVFAFLDAWNIGANDVSNAWATAVASHSISYFGAMCCAAVMEFTGAVGVGSRVAETVKSKIVRPELFAGDDHLPVLMLVMIFAVMASSLTLTAATKFGFPVSTTHTLMGGIIGAGIATVGAENVNWLENGSISSGVVQIFMSWVIGPIMSAIFAALIFGITALAVLVRKNSLYKGLFTIPNYFGFTASMIVLLLTYKGGAAKGATSLSETAAISAATGIAFCVLVFIFLIPWLYRILVCDDWQLKWYDIILGPFLLRRKGWTAPPPGQRNRVPDYYAGFAKKEDVDMQQKDADKASPQMPALSFERGGLFGSSNSTLDTDSQNDLKLSPAADSVELRPTEPKQHKSMIGLRPSGPWYSAPVFWWYCKWAILRGVDVDIFEMQRQKQVKAKEKARTKWEAERARKACNGTTDDGTQPPFEKADALDTAHASAKRYPNEVEYLFAPVQVIASCMTSFVHGANDVSNAIAPFTVIYQVWSDPSQFKGPSGEFIPGGEIPTWILVFGGCGIILGLWTYGYNVMSNLGNRLTLQTPVRAVAVQLGASTAIVAATLLSVPVSTTQCITGAIVGVSLCNGTWKALNWRLVIWIYSGWLFSLPLTGFISYSLTGFVINAPTWRGL